MQGKNPIRPPVQSDGQTLEVKKLFATLQGEGPFAGQPAVFIRLGGCNLACAFCDTDFENFISMPISDMVARAKMLAQENGTRVRHLIVITGGEPLRQNIAPLCEALIADGFKVQIETNGTLWRELPSEVSIVCSPKHTGMGYAKIRDDLMQNISAFKFIISAHDNKYKDISDVGQGLYHTPVYIQPMDEQDKKLNAENVAYALSLAQKHGYFLSLQMHKLLGIE